MHGFILLYFRFSRVWGLVKSVTPRHPLQINFQKATTQRSVILLPLCPVSLTHSNLQRWKIIHGMCPIGHKEPSINLKIFSGRISCSSDFCGCCWKIHVYFSLFCALNTCILKDYILILVNCSKELWHLSPIKFSAYVKAQAWLLVFLNWDSLVMDWNSWFCTRWVPGLTIHVTICNKITQRCKGA